MKTNRMWVAYLLRILRRAIVEKTDDVDLYSSQLACAIRDAVGDGEMRVNQAFRMMRRYNLPSV